MKGLINLIIGVVIVLAVLSAMWSTITDFVDVLTENETGAIASLGGLIPVFIIIAVVLAIIFGAMKFAGGKGNL